jgi:hypothetical protein
MRRWNLLLIFCVLFFFGAAQADQKEGAIALNADTSISVNNQRHDARISAALVVSAEGLKSGAINVDQFNLVIFGVPQSEITGRKAIGREAGTLGFAVSAGEKKLRYDPVRQTIEGELQGRINIPGYIDPKLIPVDISEQGEGDDFISSTQNARLKVMIHVAKELQNLVGVEKISSFEGKMQLGLSVEGDRNLDIPDYAIETEGIATKVDIAWAYEFARQLCVQPVRIARFSFVRWPPHIIVEYTGDGLPFGQPGAVTQWNKADLTFQWNAWQTVIDPALWAFSQTEDEALRSTVDDPGCVEVFFVDSFTPWVFWGGGASFDSGLSSAQIISTDQNADGGVDLTHLAHELGHAVSLCHPNNVRCEALAWRNPSSTGSLMCPSGFARDNPTINSGENESGVSNPLITFALKAFTPGPDCVGDFDCGPCP